MAAMVDPEQLVKVGEWLNWTRSVMATTGDALKGPTSGGGGLASVVWQVLFGWTAILDAIPLDDARFVVALAVICSVGGFLLNLVQQHNVEEECESDETDRKAAESRYALCLSTLHMLREEAPGWCDQELVSECIDLIKTDLCKAPSRQKSLISEENAVHVALLFQRLACSSSSSTQEQVQLQLAGKVDEAVRSQAMRARHLLENGPDNLKSLYWESFDRDGELMDFKVMADHLTKTVVVCVYYPGLKQEVGDMLVWLGSSDSVCVDGVSIAGRIHTMAKSLFQDHVVESPIDRGEKGKIADCVGKNKGYTPVFVGHGVAGSVACALAVMVRNHAQAKKPKEEKESWLTSAAARGACAYAFGPVPAFQGASGLKYIHSFIVGSDIFPRLTKTNIQALSQFLNEMEEQTTSDATARLECLFSDEMKDPQVSQLLQQACDRYPAIVKGSPSPSPDSTADTLAGRVYYIVKSPTYKWFSANGSEIARLALIDSTSCYRDHLLKSYEQALQHAT